MNDTQIMMVPPVKISKEISFLLDDSPIQDFLFPEDENIFLSLTLTKLFVLSKKTKKILKVIETEESNFSGLTLNHSTSSFVSNGNILLSTLENGTIQMIQLNSGKILTK